VKMNAMNQQKFANSRLICRRFVSYNARLSFQFNGFPITLLFIFNLEEVLSVRVKIQNNNLSFASLISTKPHLILLRKEWNFNVGFPPHLYHFHRFNLFQQNAKKYSRILFTIYWAIKILRLYISSNQTIHCHSRWCSDDDERWEINQIWRTWLWHYWSVN
jgi:hypothetical protein